MNTTILSRDVSVSPSGNVVRRVLLGPPGVCVMGTLATIIAAVLLVIY
jgi:hypothetical protein